MWGPHTNTKLSLYIHICIYTHILAVYLANQNSYTFANMWRNVIVANISQWRVRKCLFSTVICWKYGGWKYTHTSIRPTPTHLFELFLLPIQGTMKFFGIPTILLQFWLKVQLGGINFRKLRINSKCLFCVLLLFSTNLKQYIDHRVQF